MSDNTERPATSGGDVIRSDELVSEETGLAFAKAQAMKVMRGRRGIDGGLITRANAFDVARYGNGSKWGTVEQRLAHIAERFERRAALNRLPSGVAGNGSPQGRWFTPGGVGIPPLSSFDFSGLWLAPWIGDPWDGTASAGSSGVNPSRQLVQDTDLDAIPGTGAIVNGFASAAFSGANALETNSLGANNFLTSFVGTSFSLVNLAAAPASSGAHDDPAIWAERSRGIMLTVSASGAQACIYDGVQQVATAPFPTSTWGLVTTRYDSDLDIRIGSGPWSAPTTVGAISWTPDTIVFGKNPGVSFGLFDMLAQGFIARRCSNQECDDITASFGAYFGMAL